MKVSVRGFMMFICITLAALISFSGCSSSKEEPQTSNTEDAQQPKPEEPVQSGADANEPHRLDACATHWYYVQPGESVSVTFEKEIDSESAKTIRDEEPKLKSQEEMESAGYSLSFPSISVDTFSLSLPIWTVSHSDFEKKDSGTRTIYTKIDGTAIKWKEDGVGVIESVSGLSGVFGVGKLTSDEMSQKLGGKSTIDFTDHITGRSYSLPLEQRTMEKEINILSVSLSITVPSDNVSQQKTASVAWKNGSINFHGWYSGPAGKYTIKGPATSRDCYQ